MHRLQLVITADDFGIHRKRDEGILAAFRAGAITQASLIVNGTNAMNAARAASRVGLPLGLHLNFTEGRACSAAESLVDDSGELLGKHGFREALEAGMVEDADLVAETRAQLARFRSLTGSRALHVDGHQHVQSLVKVAEVIAPLLVAEDVRTTRIPAQSRICSANPFYEAVSDEAHAARAVFRAAGVRSTTGFAGLDLMGFDSSVEGVCDALLGAEYASVELMCHPGFAAGAGDSFNRSAARAHELDVLLAARPILSAHAALGSFIHPSHPGALR